MHKHHEPPDTTHGYELTDLSLTDITKGVIGFFIFTAVSGLVVWGGMKVAGIAQIPPGPKSRPIPEAPNPLLQTQTTAKVDMYNMRLHEKQQLSTYGKSETSEHGTRIPIDRAIEIIAEKGLGGGNSQP